MCIRWQDRVSNLEVLERAKSKSSELREGTRKTGRPKLRLKDTLKNKLNWCELEPRDLEPAADRGGWRSLIYSDVKAFKEDGQHLLESARERETSQGCISPHPDNRPPMSNLCETLRFSGSGQQIHQPKITGGYLKVSLIVYENASGAKGAVTVPTAHRASPHLQWAPALYAREDFRGAATPSGLQRKAGHPPHLLQTQDYRKKIQPNPITNMDEVPLTFDIPMNHTVEKKGASTNSESLDQCIQNALSSLYPPFQATSPTVLCQVLHVVERCYQGDGLRYLFHFLLPAKHFLQNLQQDACSPYTGLVFHHEGWPLCLHEKVVIQLCPLDPRLLHPGDFYLLVSPDARLPSQNYSMPYKNRFITPSSPCLLVCSLSHEGRHVEKQQVSPLVLRSLFGMAWLDSVNKERERQGASGLEHCLLSAHSDVFRVQWKDLVHPQFISHSRETLNGNKAHVDEDVSECVTTSPQTEIKPLPSSTKTNQTPANSDDSDSEGEYVELTDLPLPRFYPQKGSLTQSICLQNQNKTRALKNTGLDSCRPVILTPISPVAFSSTSEKEGVLSNQPECQTFQERTEGTSSPPVLNQQTKDCMEEGEVTGDEADTDAKEHLKQVQEREESVEERLGDKEHEMVQPEKVQEKWDVGEMEVRWIEGGRELDQEEVEVEEEIQVVIVKQVQRREEQRGGSQSDSCTTCKETATPVEDLDSLCSEHAETANGWEKEEEECPSEEVVGGGTVELQCKGPSSEASPSVGSSAVELEQPVTSAQVDLSGVTTDPICLTRISQFCHSSFYRVLISSGVLCLPGEKAISFILFKTKLESDQVPETEVGRAILTVCSRNAVWSNPDCDSSEVLHVLLYYSSTLRKEVRALGLTVLVDARGALPVPALFSALASLQEKMPGSVHCVLILVNKDEVLHLEKPPNLQVEALSCLKSLQKHIELHQLPTDFGGSFSYSQKNWLCFRLRVEQLTSQCEVVINLLQKTITILESTGLPAAAEEAELLLSRCKAVMCSIMADSRLVQLQQEGGACLSCLRREESRIATTDDYRAAVDAVVVLYDQVDDLLHHLVKLSNSRTEALRFIVKFRKVEQSFSEVQRWMQEVGEVHLKRLNNPEDSLELLRRKQQDFKDFSMAACEHSKRGEAMLAHLEHFDMSSADLQIYKDKVQSFWALLQDFSKQLNATGQNIDKAVRLYRFFDQAYGWALDGMSVLAGITMEDCTLPYKCQAVIGCLEDYNRQHPPIAEDHFQEMKVLAGELQGEQGLRQWSFAWMKCQETKKTFEKKMEAVKRTRDSTYRQRSNFEQNRRSRKMFSGLWGVKESSSSSSHHSPHEITTTTTCHTSTASTAPKVPSTPSDASSSSPNTSSSPFKASLPALKASSPNIFLTHPNTTSSPPKHSSPPPKGSSHPPVVSTAAQTTSPPNASCLPPDIFPTPPRTSTPLNTSTSPLLSGSNPCKLSLSSQLPSNAPSAPSAFSSLLPIMTSTHCDTAPSPFPNFTSPFMASFPHTPYHQLMLRSISSGESPDQGDICSSRSSLLQADSISVCSSTSSICSTQKQLLQKTQSLDCPSTPDALRNSTWLRSCSEPVRTGNTGVFIRGLEVSSTEATDHTLCNRTAAPSWTGQGLWTPATPRATSSPTAEQRPRGSKLRHVVDEMVATEREYVRSLRYIIHHYFPEMDRPDLPQDLRGKRSVVFGNLEKLLDFHSQFFLQELESCSKHPLRVPHCFLRHQEQFGLYALYSKNKPKSDALLANHGNTFFRRKQMELGDKMDLSSYLLKPIQRMSKYALLLSDLIKEVGAAQEAELVSLQAATSMVKFQLRHGNDLLAVDAILNCDVNLKEQGQVIRQDEFTVYSGRKKCQRHVFLFEELLLFSKPKRVEGGLDVFLYKHSFKTADVGLTESTGDSGLRFEIWFRRRTSKNQAFILQAATADIKRAWTSNIAHILWNQATRNKELRMKEMVSMGIGNKPYLDIQPSDAAISDRAVHGLMKSRGARSRASIAVSFFDHANPFKRGAVTSEPGPSRPSSFSSSLLGPLNLHMRSHSISSCPPGERSFTTPYIEEDEQETSSQPSITTESSGSSSQCLSGSTGSDSGCVSAHLQEMQLEESCQPFSSSNAMCSSNKQHLSSRYISAKSAPVISPATVV
ncbi:puratrophin-1 [Thalassophryne amazonica]|uniref:puratrophin-1 n=1 Tax=Thalassophryne amazonica TaxID=390379 RepID=UPI0014719FDA|nr:puratrophin-1 [Thalassophryne amazonica]